MTSIAAAVPGTTITVPEDVIDRTGATRRHYNHLPVVALVADDYASLAAVTESGKTVKVDSLRRLTVPQLVTPPPGARIPRPWVLNGELFVDWLPVVAIDIEAGEALAMDDDGMDVRSPTFTVPTSTEVDELRSVLAAVGRLRWTADDGERLHIDAAIAAIEARLTAATKPYLRAQQLAEFIPSTEGGAA